MNKLSRYIGLIGVLLVFTESCRSHRPTIANSEARQSEQIIPYNVESGLKYVDSAVFLKRLAKLMGMSDLSNPQHEVTLRIWLWDSDIKYVLEINKTESGDACSILAFNAKGGLDTGDIIIHEKLQHIIPKSGWQHFYFKINQINLLNLKGGKRYEDQDHRLTEMSYVQFEIAKPHYYRYYAYLEPSFYRYVDTDANTIHQFLIFLSKEFNKPIYNPSRKLFVKPK